MSLPVATSGLGARRQVAGLALLAVGLPALVVALVDDRRDLSLATPVLLVLALVVLVALVGGRRVALPAAVLGGLALNWFFTPPFGTLVVDKADQLVVLVVYLGVAVAVSVVVDLAARRTAEATRARAEAEALSTLAGATLSEQQTLPGLLEQVRTVFGTDEVALVENGQVVAVAGSAEEEAFEIRVPAGQGLWLVVRGPELIAEDRRVLASFAEAAGAALEGRRLAEQAANAVQLEAADRMRTALLAAVGHDLRTPLAAVKAAVSSLRQRDVVFSEDEREALLETVEDSADRLQGLVTNLLDASRLEAGAVSVTLGPTALVEVVDRVLLGVVAPQRVHLELPETLPEVLADDGLLERVLANLLDNALRHAPAGTIVTVTAAARDEKVACDVVDHGAGVPPTAWPEMFAPFQRLGDRTPGGVGLGLAVARGFVEAMGGTLLPRSTEGGGLTMRVVLPAVTA